MEKQAQAWIPELGLGFGQRPRRCRHLRYYYKARIYSPTLGRFPQTDPIRYEDQYHLYAYVGNDPINRVDPTGKYKCKGSNESCGYLREAVAAARRKANDSNTSPADAARIEADLDWIGAEGEPNAIGEETTFAVNPKEPGIGVDIFGDGDIFMNTDEIAHPTDGAIALGHEIPHDRSNQVNGTISTPAERMNNKVASYENENVFRRALNESEIDVYGGAAES